MTRAIVPVMVGTAGHIDHGKSSLVRALTGIDPDRLKEEKERGLTIDLGFAPLLLKDGRRLGMIDVPGHERFVKNMVAGCTSLDLALLVVAADDSVMPQTIEHVEILSLLGVRRVLVALTKIDMVDAELADLAETEVRELLARTPFTDAEIVRVSSVTRQGIDELRAKLEVLALAIPPRTADGPFRMPVQRVFKLEGIGTVVTGVPVSGTVHVGDELEFLPNGGRVRVRAIQAFGGPVDRAVAGHSTALSVPDARDLEVHRGVVAATPDVFVAGEHVDVELDVLQRTHGIAHRDPIRFHVGTAEVLGVISVLEGERLAAGARSVARVLLDEPVVAAPGDRFLLRAMNPPRTIGGGVVLQIVEGHGRYRRQRVAEQVRALVEAGSNPLQRVFEIVRHAGPAGASVADVARALAIQDDEARSFVRQHDELHWHERGHRAFTKESLGDGKVALVESVDRLLRDRPIAASISRSALRTTRDFPPELKDAVLDALLADGAVRSLANGRVLFVERLRPLEEADRVDVDRLVEHCEIAAYRPPTPAEAGVTLGIGEARVQNLAARAIDEGRLEAVGEHLYGATPLRSVLLAICANCLANSEVLDIPKLRDELTTSRKYLIPLLEHVDGLGLTRLRGGERRLLVQSDAFAALKPLLAK
ncbi:MAG: selenocysteine-specific translation elongation factor [Planctomycetes bacterium]|nr:selenocysteine-specific translation elongation factor [Planctomycetota bacterium]